MLYATIKQCHNFKNIHEIMVENCYDSEDGYQSDTIVYMIADGIELEQQNNQIAIYTNSAIHCCTPTKLIVDGFTFKFADDTIYDETNFPYKW